MGYNTTVVVINDSLHDIEGDPNFGRKLAAAIRRGPLISNPIDVSAGSHVNAATVIETHHADSMHLIEVGANYGQDLGYVGGWRSGIDTSTIEGKKELLRRLADNFGLKISIRDGR